MYSNSPLCKTYHICYFYINTWFSIFLQKYSNSLTAADHHIIYFPIYCNLCNSVTHFISLVKIIPGFCTPLSSPSLGPVLARPSQHSKTSYPKFIHQPFSFTPSSPPSPAFKDSPLPPISANRYQSLHTWTSIYRSSPYFPSSFQSCGSPYRSMIFKISG